MFQQALQVFTVDEQRTVALLPPGAGLREEIEPRGTLLQTPGFEPSPTDSIIHFNPVDSLDRALERVEAAGGQVTFAKFCIGNGYLATFLDSEGNTVGLLEWDQV